MFFQMERISFSYFYRLLWNLKFQYKYKDPPSWLRWVRAPILDNLGCMALVMHSNLQSTFVESMTQKELQSFIAWTQCINALKKWHSVIMGNGLLLNHIWKKSKQTAKIIKVCSQSSWNRKSCGVSEHKMWI